MTQGLTELSFTPQRIETGVSKFDLTLFIIETQERLSGAIEYNSDLFDASTLIRMATHLRELLSAAVSDPAIRISDLSFMPPAERRQILEEWNATRVDYPTETIIHKMFEAQVERTPDACALVFNDEKVTYRELNARANQLAHYLRSLNVRPDSLVGICMERSVNAIISLLAILKAGGAYVALDPAYPNERLSFMLNDARPLVALTQSSLQDHLSGCNKLCLDANWETVAEHSDENLHSGVSLDNLIYLVYTSGSTGRPKAIAMTQRCLSNYVAWQLRRFKYPPPATTLQFSSLNFDVSILEMFSTWCSGGALALVSEEVRMDAVELLRLIEKENLNRLFIPFVVLRHIAEIAEAETSAPAGLREITTAGEQLQVTKPIIDLFRKLNGCALDNQYGPSEAHGVTACKLEGDPDLWPQLPPVGRPISNTEIYLLEGNLNPVPIGAMGEIYIGGVSLARGYLKLSSLTAEKFIPDPFSQRSGARLYRTGDLGRWLQDGNIEFLGRADQQVKIRGFRIELGEVEAALGQHANLKDVVVIAREDRPGDKRLVAYAVPEQTVPTASELRLFMKGKLPEYMVPSAFVMLDDLPISPSGKVNHRALPPPDAGAIQREKAFVAPRNSIEERLAQIWQEILQIELVSVNANFFDLGGHSLRAAQINALMRSRFQLNIPLRNLFEHPTIEELAMLIEDMILDEVEELSEEAAERLASR